ncbi:amidohydrolase family protein [Candidatus Formimonas warabiya]|uniref:amidohydrolase family protein n=1 Tax=Formimonas warabiya TaxID=1761012 RepID=UPI001BE41415|nr:amidohydrolase family protein [Candidatus Formimonas warabiya]
MEGNKFYDVHCHVMNLSHPNFLAFLRRFESTISDQKLKIFLAANIVIVSYLLFHSLNPKLLAKILDKVGVSRLIDRVKNLLVVMEHDAGTVFGLLEKGLRQQLWEDGRFTIENFHYDKIILTPLMMDFGYKNMTDPALAYNSIPVQKPIVEQVLDLFNGIRNYYPAGETGGRVFEIYPFLGINTANYDLSKIGTMLEKYFSGYRGTPEDLAENLGKFNGDIEELGSNFFSGIKVYPPLGFDPWPEQKEERKKVELLYEYCTVKHIPLTTHCSNGGYRIVDRTSADEFTSPARWKKVLKRFPGLKINFGHLGNQGRKREWGQEIFALMEGYEHVYGDFSCRGFNDRYYRSLRELLCRANPSLRDRLRERILFGSDFMINLLWADSYNSYLGIFKNTPFFSAPEKHDFCSINPERFLFHS